MSGASSRRLSYESELFMCAVFYDFIDLSGRHLSFVVASQ